MSKKRGPEQSEQRKLAEKAGLSRAQMWRALKVASIPHSEFERLVESDNPPTVAELVRIGAGTSYRPQNRRVRRCPHCGGDLTQNLTATDAKMEPTP